MTRPPDPTFVVRGYELDASGTVPVGTVARYVEETRWAVALAGGGLLEGKMRRGVVRAQVVEYGEVLRYPDAFRVETWVARLGRTSLDFGHQVVRARDGAVVARNRSTLVSLGPDGPAPLDPSLADHVEARATPAHPPLEGAAPGDAFRRRWVVRPSDQDSFRHQNQSRYFDAVEDTLRLAAMAGHPAGTEPPPRAVAVSFEREVHAGSEVEMRLWQIEGGVRRLELSRVDDGAVIARARAEAR